MKIIRFDESSKQDRPDGRIVRKLLQQELGMTANNWQFLYVTHPPGLKEDLHSHSISYEALYFMDKANYKINGNDYRLNENDLVIFEPGDIHGAIPIDNEVRLLVIQVPIITDDKKVYK